VRVARQRDSAVAARQVIERAGAGVRRLGQLVGRVQQVKTQRGQHLVVARAAEMHTPAGRADARRQALLERGLARLRRRVRPSTGRRRVRWRARSGRREWRPGPRPEQLCAMEHSACAIEARTSYFTSLSSSA
jgi:hypothetical protein